MHFVQRTATASHALNQLLTTVQSFPVAKEEKKAELTIFYRIHLQSLLSIIHH